MLIRWFNSWKPVVPRPPAHRGVCVCLVHAVLHDYETECHVMSPLNITVASWRSDLPPVRMQAEDRSGRDAAVTRQCTPSDTRGGVWPPKSANITNPRPTFWHRPSVAPLAHERDGFSLKNTELPTGSVCLSLARRLRLLLRARQRDPGEMLHYDR